jgi:hypothetical protein
MTDGAIKNIFVQAHDCSWVAKMEHCGKPYPDCIEQHRANARLIAAAPNLLAACKAAKDWRDADGTIGSSKERAAFDELDAAVAKATD